MIPRWSDWTTGPRIALAALAGSAVIAVASAAFPIEVKAPVESSASHEQASIGLRARFVPDPAEMSNAAGRLPFAPAATQTPVSGPVVQAAAPTAPATLQPRLLGTVVEGESGGFVVMEQPGGQIEVVRVGERTAGGMRLRAVFSGRAVFTDDAGARLTLRTAPAGSEPRP